MRVLDYLIVNCNNDVADLDSGLICRAIGIDRSYESATRSCQVQRGGDFRRVVEMVGNRGVRVEVMAFGNSTSQDLRETADRYIDIAAYVPELTG